MARNVAFKEDQVKNKRSYLNNVTRKAKERDRRARRMIAVLKKGETPFTHDVMCWLSREIDKPTRKITPEDIKAFVTANA